MLGPPVTRKATSATEKPLDACSHTDYYLPKRVTVSPIQKHQPGAIAYPSVTRRFRWRRLIFLAMILTVSVKEVIADPRLQMRAKVDDDHIIAEYADNVFDLPPGKIVKGPGGELWMVDGFKRLRAHIKAGCLDMRFEIANGSWIDALTAAAGANSTHGQRRSQADKKRAVLALLSEPSWPDRSDRYIANICRVSHPFVAQVRDEWEESQNEPAQKTRASADGRRRPATTKPKPRCERCTRLYPSTDTSIDGCTRCAELQAPKPRKKRAPSRREPKEAYYDDSQAVVPSQLNGVFAMVEDYKELSLLFHRASVIIKRIEESPASRKKPLTKGHFEKFSVICRRAWERARNLRPAVVHKKCGGDGCKICQEEGYLSDEEYKLEKETI